MCENNKGENPFLPCCSSAAGQQGLVLRRSHLHLLFRLRPEGAAAGLYKPVRFRFFFFFFSFSFSFSSSSSSVKGFFILEPQREHLEPQNFQGSFYGPIVTSRPNLGQKGRLGMVPGPPKWAKNAFLEQFFTVMLQPDDLRS